MTFDQMAMNMAGKLNVGQQGAVITQGPKGPGLIYAGQTIHDADNPVDEALGWIKNCGRGGGKPGLALVFGLGLGWHLKMLRKQYPKIKLVVFEPVLALKDAYERNTVMTEADGPPPMIITEWQEYEKTAGKEIVYGEQSGMLVVSPDGYRTIKPEAYIAFERYARRELMRRAVVDRTRESTGWDFLKNLSHNAGLTAEYPDLMILRGRLPARPAFVVGSGPSLDKNVDELRNVGSNGLILAASSALKPLLAHGVSPDVVVVIESSDTSDYLKLSPEEMEVMGPNTVLALASSCHPNHFKVEGFHKALFHLTAGEAQTFSQGVFLPQGGNAGSTAFSLAYTLGLAPLILVAQDQAFEDGKLHAGNTPGEEDLGDVEYITVEGIGGGEVQTDSGLLASINWFVEAARTVNESSSGSVSLFNASASGARLAGFNEVPLGSIVASLAPVQSKLDLAAVLPKLPRPTNKEVYDDVAQMAKIVSTLRRFATMDPKKAYEEINNVRQISRFLGQVLAEASVSGNRSDLVNAMNKADELMTVMLTSLS
ncbi:hypothetical protein C4J81_13040 [Deltaproteobacteria bacterium Smac51]|nr:hypothetical protein C4J81_13040 [Deltaproteobacteria bacterium Smac51]